MSLTKLRSIKFAFKLSLEVFLRDFEDESFLGFGGSRVNETSNIAYGLTKSVLIFN